MRSNLHLEVSCIHRPLSPLALPGEELNKLDGQDDLIHNRHPLVPSFDRIFVDDDRLVA